MVSQWSEVSDLITNMQTGARIGCTPTTMV